MTTTTVAGAQHIQAAFDRAAAEDRAALIVYLTSCFPDPDTSRACFEAAVEAGADVLEIGVPFSDPMMDGPIIQAANQHVLDAGTRVADHLALIRSLDHLAVPKLVMTYVTIADTRGYAAFADECAAAGLAGVILPDLPVPEADAWRREAQRAGLATVFLASSVSTDARLDAIGAASQGWVYATGLLGVTGVKGVSQDVTRALVERVRPRTSVPVAVGIGVKDRGSAAEVAAYADGVIVGSSVVRAVADGDPAGAPGRVGALVRELREGVSRR
ncbi:tryptophan synthase subunit alpha [Egicoccus halophilus]|uniref:Tryptophan synthase alpha chain n=1 Tax=Egicoccus halophilus TaxID=1670830 RepID=A0A8J3A6D0_9ACTN|nr:tryptophan synthase subunit alpha [Egicoccus halophilus]GGI04401.1 tryptophan synthase alpha chain [Egicoccus halophilus]